jgi:hypothetical protein
MADDDRPDARDPQIAGWLEVEPLDDLARRRLVSKALRESEEPARRPSRAWRWMAAAAALVVLVTGTLALVTARGGNDEQQASTPVRTPEAAGSATAKAAGAPDVGDFGDLDQPGRLAALRRALDSPPAAAIPAAPPTAAGASGFANDSAASERSSAGAALSQCSVQLPDGNVVAQGHGTIGGRAATVVLIETAAGKRSLDAVLSDPCELRHLSDSG